MELTFKKCIGINHQIAIIFFLQVVTIPIVYYFLFNCHLVFHMILMFP